MFTQLNTHFYFLNVNLIEKFISENINIYYSFGLRVHFSRNAVTPPVEYIDSSKKRRFPLNYLTSYFDLIT